MRQTAEGLSKRLDAGQQAAVNKLLLVLEEKGRQQIPRPLDNALIFGNWNVAYTSVQNASKQRGEREYCKDTHTQRILYSGI